MLKFLLKMFGYDPDDPANEQEFEVKEEKRDSGLIVPSISRRKFLIGAGVALAAAALPTKAFSFPPVRRKYLPGQLTPEMLRTFLKQITVASPERWSDVVMHPSQYATYMALQLEKVNDQIPMLIENDTRLMRMVTDPHCPPDRIIRINQRINWTDGIRLAFKEVPKEELNRLYPKLSRSFTWPSPETLALPRSHTGADQTMLPEPDYWRI